MRAEPPLLPLLLEGVTYAVAGRTLIDRISLTIEAGPRFVSRGGDKLEGALDDFSARTAPGRACCCGSATA